ncbi:MAG TPA: glycoside hydrolase family 16 protein [Ktedonobacteraceae bacterium]
MFASHHSRSAKIHKRHQPAHIPVRQFWRLFLLTVPLSLLLSACQADAAASSSFNPLPVGQKGLWTLIFHDEFDGNSLDTSKWTTCYFNFKVGNDDCSHTQDELQLYQPANVTVGNGLLTLRAQKKLVTAANGHTYHYTSGMITTGPTSSSSYDTRFSFKYGYIEMRANIPAGRGLWPAFWTLPTDLSWPPEIDVFEILGHEPNIINMHYHYPDATGKHIDTGSSWAGPNFSSGWHTYALNWQPDAITWYVDGVARASYTNASHISDKQMYLLANLAVGGNWPGDPDATTPFPALYQIDYIRVWHQS